MQAFQLHERLQADTFTLEAWPLCDVLLLNDRRFPWLVLVPRCAGVSEIHQLDAADRTLLMEEIVRASRWLERACCADKINIGALGNIVPQLHLHVVARFRNDAAWPGPVWGSGSAVPYDEATLTALRARLAECA